MKTFDVIHQFWFEELTPADWFGGGDSIDGLISKRFTELHHEVVVNEHANWRETAKGAVVEIIVLDQFSRNIYRGKHEAFAADNQALALAQVAINRGFETELSTAEKQFLYLPFMHSESKKIHKTALALFKELGNEESLQYEQIHKDIIDQFNRYPHRNQVLGRKNTPEEDAYLADTQYDFFNA